MKATAPETCQRIEKGIYQRGEFSYQVKMMVGGHAISETFDTIEEARSWRDSKRLGKSLDPDFKKVLESRIKKSEVRKMTLDKALDKYLLEVTPSKKGSDEEKHRINKLRRTDLAKKSFYQITPEDVLELLKGLKRDPTGPRQGEPLSSESKRKYASLISHVYDVARKRWRMTVTNPVADIELPPPGKSRTRRLEAGEEEALLHELSKARQASVVVPLVRLAIETAMRQGELLALEWSDVRISGDHGTAVLRDTKIGEQRIVPLSAHACELLGSMPRPIKGGLVFPIGKNSLRTVWDLACKRAGIEDLRFHDLRHEATSRLFELGLDRIEAASITGHKTLQMLKNYTHLRAEKLAKKINSVRKTS